MYKTSAADASHLLKADKPLRRFGLPVPMPIDKV
jgi:hypothetical protein